MAVFDNRFSDGGSSPAEHLKVPLLDGSTENMAVDGSSNAVTYSYTVAAGKRAFIHRMTLYMEDATAFDSNLFGGMTALTNGVEITAAGSTLATWKNNVDINLSMYDVEGRAIFGKATQTMAGRWTFSRDSGQALQLEAGESFSAVVNDNLTGLVTLRMVIGGRLVDL